MKIPTSSELVKETAYDKKNAADYDNYRFTDQSGKAIHRMEMSVLHQALTLFTSGSQVLEVGCGTGRLMREVFDKGYKVDGVDASGPMLEEAAAKFDDLEHPPEFMLCEAAALPVPDASYDLCYSIRLLNQTESAEYALRVVREMVRVTKPGGKILVEFVNEYRPRWGLNERPTTRLKPQNVRVEAESVGGRFISWKGAFFLGMQTYKKCPRLLLPLISTSDAVLSKLFPRLCSRVYLLIEKA